MAVVAGNAIIFLFFLYNWRGGIVLRGGIILKGRIILAARIVRLGILECLECDLEPEFFHIIFIIVVERDSTSERSEKKKD